MISYKNEVSFSVGSLGGRGLQLRMRSRARAISLELKGHVFGEEVSLSLSSLHREFPCLYLSVSQPCLLKMHSLTPINVFVLKL